MIKSMTGFGRCEISEAERKFTVELKGVNHRYLDINVRIPRQLMYLEETIKKVISSQIKRGKIEVFINFKDKKQEGEKVLINKDMAKMNEKLVKFFEDQKNRDTLNRLRQLLGQQRKEEEYLLGERTYKPRAGMR